MQTKEADKKAVVCFSGGQDSTTALAMALKSYEAVYTIGFDYGQRHAAELECRSRILADIEPLLGTRALGGDLLIDLSQYGRIAECALTRSEAIIFDDEKGLPNTFVPGRNLLFVTYAAALAYRVGAHDIILGVSEQDYSGYPDCREESLEPLALSLSRGMEYPIRVVAPFMHCSKAHEWKLARETGGDALVDFIVRQTHTCYTGEHSRLHTWGYGCGECPACRLRAKGYEEYLQKLAKEP